MWRGTRKKVFGVLFAVACMHAFWHCGMLVFPNAKGLALVQTLAGSLCKIINLLLGGDWYCHYVRFHNKLYRSNAGMATESVRVVSTKLSYYCYSMTCPPFCHLACFSTRDENNRYEICMDTNTCCLFPQIRSESNTNCVGWLSYWHPSIYLHTVYINIHVKTIWTGIRHKYWIKLCTSYMNSIFRMNGKLEISLPVFTGSATNLYTV